MGDGRKMELTWPMEDQLAHLRKLCKSRDEQITALEAENARLRGTMRLHECKTCDGGGLLFRDNGEGSKNCHDCDGTGWDMSDRRRAERAEAACAEMREALRALEGHCTEGATESAGPHRSYDMDVTWCAVCYHIEADVSGHADDCPFVALSTTCGERYARIAEAAEKAKAYADKWGGDINLALVNKIFEALAAKEPNKISLDDGD